MTLNPRTAFFDGIADQWDGWEDLTALERKLTAGLQELGVEADEWVLDVGCGTGNLTRALLARLSPAGRVFAVDLSPRMLELAQRKIADPRVSWHAADARRLPLGDAACDRVLCCSVWPHFDDCAAVAVELGRVLAPGGLLHVWHLIPREKVNAIHAGAGEAVRGDVLPPAAQTAALLGAAGFRIVTASEADDRYLVTAMKPEG
ncbi:MAG TPA: class I SAM-dependent methyltransferase [Polyangiaceae bacterium]|nr:class I SAM-dependent methyltransferase [Polyangiaceae bacterium]